MKMNRESILIISLTAILMILCEFIGFRAGRYVGQREPTSDPALTETQQRALDAMAVAMPEWSDPKSPLDWNRCRRDLLLWDDPADRGEFFFNETKSRQTGKPNPMPVTRLPLSEIQHRQSEMNACSAIKPPEGTPDALLVKLVQFGGASFSEECRNVE